MSTTEPSCRTGKAKSESDLEALIAQLDQAAAEDAPESDRGEQRYPYRQRCRARIQQPGDAGPSTHTVMPRNLGKSGMSVLHSGFVHAKSRCEIQLVTLQGSWHDVEGSVVSCRYVGQSVHEVCIRFDEAIEPTDFCREAIRNRILVVDDDKLMTRLAKVLFEKLNAEVEVAGSGEEAIEKAMGNVFDLVLMDVEMPELDGIEATKQLRSKGYAGIIVAASAHTQPEDRQRCLEAGCDVYLAKPYTQEKFAKAIESAQQKPIYSVYAEDPAMTEIINAFVAELPERIRAIEETAAAGDLQTLRGLVRGLKAEGASFGFDGVTTLAESIEESLIKSCAITELRGDLDRLVKLCVQIRPSPRAESA